MAQTADNYQNNPLTHRDRRLSQSASAWGRSFSCEDLKPLIVCRGPIRKEAMDVYEEMGISHYGILLSEKDSIVYANALAPELRQLTDTNRVHRVPDYTGASKEERVERIEQIIRIAKDNGYDSIFAGYGFMAEDDEFVAAIEEAELKFIGPCAATQRGAGKKDEAKRTARGVDVSVTPGIDNVTARTLVKKHPSREALVAVVKAEGLSCDEKLLGDAKLSLEDLADLPPMVRASHPVAPPRPASGRLAASNLEEYRDLYRRSIESPGEYWSTVANEFEWFAGWPATPALTGDLAQGFEYFPGAMGNVSVNCVDRHAKSSRRRKAAINPKSRRRQNDRQIHQVQPGERGSPHFVNQQVHQADEREDGRRHPFDGVDQADQAVKPDPVVVHRSALHRRGQPLAQPTGPAALPAPGQQRDHFRGEL